jgi:hypothetical protein
VVFSQADAIQERTDLVESENRKRLREKLQEVEADLAEVRHTAMEMRRQIGERWFEPTDDPERAALITAAEEQEAFAEELTARREELLRRLGEQE